MRSPIQAAKRRRSSNRGATMVEFAIISFALFTLIFGIIEGGFAVRARSAVNNAVDDVSAPDVLDASDLRGMATDPIIFAMANPNPEITPEAADGLAAIMATGRSDYPNQINNVLAFPGLFRGALDVGATDITESMKLAAAENIASVVGDDLAPDYIIPSVFDPRVLQAVAPAVSAAAIADGVIRS